MLSINMDDVIKVLNSIKSQLIGFGVVAVLLIAVMIACRKQSKSKKYLIRWQAGLGMVLALAITVNLILTGPMYSMVTLATGNGKVSEENVASATQLCENIADEGIVLLDNDGTLPMAKNSKLNVFGWASTNPCYGGTGSGALSDAYPTVTLLEGLKNAGFELNTELSDFYTSYRADRPEVGMFAQDWTLPEPEAAQYTDEMMNNAKAFSDTAMVVITRVGGEGADLPTDVSQVTYDAGHSYNDFEPGDHYLQLSKTEKDMMDLVCKNFDKVVVVYNSANAMELGWVKDYSQIKSVIWCAGTGQSGFNALGSILCGDVNPSGRTIDTFVYDLTQTPTANNFGNFTYTNMDEFKANAFGTDTIPAFVNYVEGIYVGYKFYETAAAEGLIDYDKEVVYPFGYGLSYTTFTKEMSDITSDGTNLNFSVTVTNTGSVAGKDVVEIYSNPPYTNGGIEKASANLLDFAKTSELAPGASETIEFSIPVEDLASYDYQTNGCYVLEAGDYVISANDDSHNVADSQTYTVASEILYNESNKRDSDAVAATNEFDFAEGEITYLSRADGFANYAEATAAPANYEMSDADKAAFDNAHTYVEAGYQQDDDANAADITTDAKNGLKLADLRGVDYNDPQWDALLDQMSIDDLQQIIGFGGYQTASISSIDKVRTNDCDGPASINNNFTGVGSVGFPAATLIGMTWSKDLAHAFGDSIGGLFTALGIMYALFHRQRTGEGQYLEVSMSDAMLHMIMQGIVQYTMTGVEPGRIGCRDLSAYPYDIFEAKDGYCILGNTTVNKWDPFAEAIGHPELIDDPRFDTNEHRVENADELFVYINDWTKQRTRAEIEKIIADEFRQAYSPVLRVSEVIENEQFLARDMIVDMEGPDVGKYKMQGIPIKMMATPGEVRTSAPVCGQDNNDILKELGRTEEEIAALKEHGVI